jgi:hypothetical protein
LRPEGVEQLDAFGETARGRAGARELCAQIRASALGPAYGEAIGPLRALTEQGRELSCEGRGVGGVADVVTREVHDFAAQALGDQQIRPVRERLARITSTGQDDAVRKRLQALEIRDDAHVLTELVLDPETSASAPSALVPRAASEHHWQGGAYTWTDADATKPPTPTNRADRLR